MDILVLKYEDGRVPQALGLTKKNMKKNVFIFGIILGLIMVGHMFYIVTKLYNDPDLITNDLVGYAAMVIVFSLTFFGTLNYRNKELGGVITFGKAFQTGALIALVGSTIYVVAWLFYYYLFVPDFIDQYASHVIADTARKGATEEELAIKTKELASLKKMYQNPVFVVLITYSEVLPVGLGVALISSWVLRRKKKRVQELPAEPTA